MSEALVATPGSTADSSGMGKTPAAKDKQCPFCRAPFTSSSLGRHLDLYIKEKNPKPPDGIHDVNEIRKLRGSVTRRQARTSSTKREGSTPSSAKPTPMPEQQSPSAPVFFPDNSQVDGGQVKTSLNRANWQATAVINDLPPPSTEVHSAHNRRRNMLRKPPIKEEVVRKQKTLEEKDRGQAAELALQEVLNRVKAANFRAHPRSLLDYNWFSHSFPALCLRCLSAPLPLLTSPSKPNQAAWPIEPPGVEQLRDVERWLESKLSKWKQRPSAMDGHERNKGNGMSDAIRQHRASPEISENTDVYAKHLSNAYQNWKSVPENQKVEIWRLECQKAFVREQENHSNTTSKLHQAEQELQQLRAQLHQQSARLRPTASSHLSPSTTLLSSETLDILGQDGNLAEWDFERFISRWTAQIQSERNGQQPLPSTPIPNMWPQIPDAAPLTNGTPYTPLRQDDQPSHHHDGPSVNHENSEEDEDLADAPGDDDDEMRDQPPPVAIMDRQVLDPDLRDRSTLMNDSDPNAGTSNGEGYGGRMLLGLRDYERAMDSNGNL